MVSILSRAVRTFTGGKSIGETIGGAIGSQFGPAGASIGQSIGGSVTEILDTDKPDVSTAPATAGIDSGQTLALASQTSQVSRGRNQARFPMQRPSGMINIQAPPQQAGFGLPLVLPAVRNFLTKSPVGGIATGVGTALVGEAIFDAFGQPKKLVITKKMQREVKEIFMFSGGDLQTTAELFSQFRGMSYSADNILAILLKKFSNQGPYVTKAAVRKTRSTLRKMKTLQDITNDLMPRRAPARRRSTSAMKTVQIKN